MATFMKNVTLVSQSAALFRDEKLKEAGVSGYQARYVLSVFNNEGISQDKLAKMLIVNKSNVARQVTALEESGYLKREQSENDRRVMLVYTTDKGKALVPTIREANKKWRQVLCEGLSEEEQESLSRMLEKMVENARSFLEVEI